MTLESILIFVPACLALNMAPGPNNLLAVSNATRHGMRVALMAGAGRILAFACMIAIASAGAATILLASETLFLAIKVCGALYLLYLAFRLWRAPALSAADDPAAMAPKRSGFALARQEFWVAAGNPKAILIFTAFLPQFVDLQEAVAPQFALYGALFLALEWVAIGSYAYLGAHLGRWFTEPRSRQLFNRCCGALLGMAGVGLLLSRRAA